MLLVEIQGIHNNVFCLFVCFFNKKPFIVKKNDLKLVKHKNQELFLSCKFCKKLVNFWYLFAGSDVQGHKSVKDSFICCSVHRHDFQVCFFDACS